MRFSPKTQSNDIKYCFNENICELIKLEFHKIYFRNHYRIVVIAIFFFKDAVIILEPNEISHQNKLSLEKKWCLKEEGILLVVGYYSVFFQYYVFYCFVVSIFPTLTHKSLYKTMFRRICDWLLINCAYSLLLLLPDQMHQHRKI